jgi:hypothetical protein
VVAALAITLVWSVGLAHALLEVRDRHHAYVIPVLLPVAAVAVVALIDAIGAALAKRRGGGAGAVPDPEPTPSG